MSLPAPGRFSPFVLVLLFVLAGCDQQGPALTASEMNGRIAETPATQKKKGKQKTDEKPQVSLFLGEVNERLAAEDVSLRVHKAEFVTPVASGQAGQVVFSKNRGNKQLGADFVPGDPRRDGRTNITYVVDEADGATSGGLTNAETEPAIDRAMATWEESTQCSRFAIEELPYPGLDLGAFEAAFTDSSFPLPLSFADIIHAGWLSAGFFDTLTPGGGDFILGVTFTFLFVDENGTPTDVNDDGKLDVAFREIYYNDNFEWGINAGVSPYDVETVALHEAGHGLSQAHFGKIFLTPKNGKVHFAPFAVMNASISRQAQHLEGTDRGGHCSLWGSWPDR